MMEYGVGSQLVGSEIHGFKTMQDLDVPAMFEEAKTRWLRPNEIHAILCNYKHFTVYVKPVNLPKSGTIVLFDRKMLRNFRRDGHSWKKKKDGKTVKEAHEHLKVGNDERIHVYYAHGEDQSTFVRRCYWLLDKSLEHIVLVHYRDTQELQGSPPTVESNSSSDPPISWNLSEEGVDQAYYDEPNETIINHEMRLHEINTLEWDELVVPDGSNKLTTPAGGSKIPGRDDQGQGVIHMCAILDYTWAIFPYSWSGLSIDFRDKFGWTALHWAAHYGRQRCVASLLSAGANPNLVTDPTPDNPGGCTPADLASKSGYEGLAAFLAEKALLAHFQAMTLAGNVSGSLQSTIPTDDDFVTGTNVNEEEQYLKDTLAAYRRAADAAARIQAAFREQSFKLKSKAVEYANTEDEARCIIAAMRIQHAYRKHETKKQMAAATRIQYRFRTWQIRKDFLNKRRQAIKIQAYFRGFQVRRQYKKIVWSVGVLEKAILRWRLKRKGFRGLQVAPDEDKDEKEESVCEESFFGASRKQAEERVERSVVRVQAMFRSKKAQEEYRKMKLAHNQTSI
ncbi:hypothetical protein M8C21_015487 [Ambrosia artemisiifolia]|uniref:CG-1 domain-containing protein n=1 Tax=Ambrosia artemisiifolia TaxID=4212 RepID=A0AAD5G434_AMBAR|nr:hypothetical protein M8C21_015487 [Ambrosia artemisiifolia]